MHETAGKPSNDRARLFTFDTRKGSTPWLLTLLSVALMAAALTLEGRIWWCVQDTPLRLVTIDAWSTHTSQHFLDPYALTHLLHGFIFLWALDLVAHRILGRKISFAWLMFFAVLAESCWEVIENSPFIIERYRESTASLDYFGDSIANSIGDVISCALGFIIAYELRFRRALAVFIAVEIFLIVTIRDSLLINIIMLVYPIEAIKLWQTGGI